MPDVNDKRVFDLFYSLKLKSFKRKHFLTIYDRIFQQWISENPGLTPTVVEVGSAHGGFLEFIYKYFDGKCQVIGIDIEINHLIDRFHLASDLGGVSNINFVKGNSGDVKFWENFWRVNGNSVDIFIEDSGHTNKQQILSIEMALQKIKSGGVVICEDTEASFMSDFGNPHPFSFMNWVYRFTSLQNLALLKPTNSFPKNFEIQLYPSLVVFKKNGFTLTDYDIVGSGGRETKEFGSIFPSIVIPFFSSSKISSLLLSLSKSLVGKLVLRLVYAVLKFWRFNNNLFLYRYFKKNRSID